MVSAEAVIANVLGAAAYAAGAYLAVEHILPKIKVIAAEVLRYPKTADALVFLLSILIYIFAAQGIITKVLAIGAPALNYLSVVTPVIDVINSIVPTVRLLLIGIGIVLLAERIRLRA